MFTEKPPAKQTKLPFIGWLILTFLAVNIGLGALRYALPDVPFPASLPNFHLRHNWLIIHATVSAVAIIIGPWQFLPRLRRRSWAAHRWIGRIYCLAVLVGWIASLPIAAHAQTGSVASIGFLALGVLWMITTSAGYFAIRQRRVQAHREWMIRSYALIAAAITLRLYLAALQISGVPFTTAYPLVAWLSWIPNLLFAEWLVRRGRAPAVRLNSQTLSVRS